MAQNKTIADSPWWAVAAVLITAVSLAYAFSVGGQNSTNAVDIKDIKEKVHSLDVDRNVAKTEYNDLKETMIQGFQEQKEATREIKALMKSHLLMESGLSLLSSKSVHNP